MALGLTGDARELAGHSELESLDSKHLVLNVPASKAGLATTAVAEEIEKAIRRRWALWGQSSRVRFRVCAESFHGEHRTL